MRVIIIAAGSSTRLCKETIDIPKGLLKINDRSITEGKLRNEVRNYFFTLDGIFQQKSRIHSHDRAVCLCAAHYKRLNRSSWKII